MEHPDRIRSRELQHTFSELLREHKLKCVEPGGGSLDRGFQLIQNFELLSSQLYQLRRQTLPDDPFREQTEDYMAQIAAEVMSVSTYKDPRRYQAWVATYRTLWQRHFALFLMTAIVFVATCVLGWILATQYTAYATVLIPQSLMENIIQKNAWFESAGDNPLLTGAQLAWHNIRVCVTAFALSAVLGLGGLYILCFNGIFFGVVMGFCYLHGFNEPLTQFVISHGPLELSIIVASAFAGLVYGRVFFMRPLRLFGARFRTAGREAGVLVTGIVPWLVLAGFIESFISPNPGIPSEIRIFVGAFAAVLFWIWNFYPAKTEDLSVR